MKKKIIGGGIAIIVIISLFAFAVAKTNNENNNIAVIRGNSLIVFNGVKIKDGVPFIWENQYTVNPANETTMNKIVQRFSNTTKVVIVVGKNEFTNWHKKFIAKLNTKNNKFQIAIVDSNGNLIE